MQLIKTKSFELAVLTNGSEKSTKIALLLPGRLDTKDYINFTSHLGYLGSKGFYAIAIDPPGTWESPGGVELFTTTNYVKAINELVEYFGNKPTLLIGHSRGAAVALLVAKGNPNVVGVVALMPNLASPTSPDPESIERGYQISHRDMPPGTHRTQEQKIFNLPLNYYEDGRRYDPALAAENLGKPKMILYGDKDEFMTPLEAEKICAEIPEPKIIRELKSTHDYRYHPEVIEEVNGLIGQFVGKYLS